MKSSEPALKRRKICYRHSFHPYNRMDELPSVILGVIASFASTQDYHTHQRICISYRNAVKRCGTFTGPVIIRNNLSLPKCYDNLYHVRNVEITFPIDIPLNLLSIKKTPLNNIQNLTIHMDETGNWPSDNFNLDLMNRIVKPVSNISIRGNNEFDKPVSIPTKRIIELLFNSKDTLNIQNLDVYECSWLSSVITDLPSSITSLKIFTPMEYSWTTAKVAWMNLTKIHMRSIMDSSHICQLHIDWVKMISNGKLKHIIMSWCGDDINDDLHSLYKLNKDIIDASNDQTCIEWKFPFVAILCGFITKYHPDNVNLLTGLQGILIINCCVQGMSEKPSTVMPWIKRPIEWNYNFASFIEHFQVQYGWYTITTLLWQLIEHCDTTDAIRCNKIVVNIDIIQTVDATEAILSFRTKIQSHDWKNIRVECLVKSFKLRWEKDTLGRTIQIVVKPFKLF